MSCKYFSVFAPNSALGLPPGGINSSVGSAFIPNLLHNSFSLSAFTLRNRTLPLYFSAKPLFQELVSCTGHTQVAQKSITTGLSHFDTNSPPFR